MNNYTGHKFIFFNFAILIAIFGLLFIASKAKATELLADDYFKANYQQPNDSDISIEQVNNVKAVSFVASTTNISSIEILMVEAQYVDWYCNNIYQSCTASDFYTVELFSDSALTTSLGVAQVAYNVTLPKADISGIGWCMANDCYAYTRFTFDTPIVVTPSSTYYFKFYPLRDDIWIGSRTFNGWGSGNTTEIGYKLYYHDSYSASDNYIMYYGANPVYILTNTEMDLPVVYNVCDDWEEDKNYYIKLFDDSNNTIGARQKINTCSGTIRYNPYSWLWDLSETANFAIFEENDETIPANWIVKSNSFILTVYTQVLSGDNYIKYDIDSPLYIKTDTIGSTTVPIAYDVCSDINFATGEINLYDYDTGIAIGSANYPLSSFGGCSGVFNAVIDWGAYSNISHTAQFSYINGGSKLANGDIFQLIFYSTDIPDTIALASDAHNQACTASEWTLAETEYLVDLRCRAVETFIETSNTITKDLKYQLSELASRFKNLFPFNFAQQIKLCWELSETADMPEKLDFLGSDSNGNIAIPVLSGLTGNTTTTAVIWGNGIFNTSTTTKEIFDKSRELSTWVLKGIFIIYIFYIGRKFYFELIGKNTNEIDND